MGRQFVILMAATALSACALPPMTPEGSKVGVHRQYSTTLDACKKIGPVTGTITKRFWRPSDQRAFVMLKNAVAETGGDTAVVLQQETIGSEVIQHGIAFRCY